VWLVGDDIAHLKPTFAAGEEKTYFNAPPGFGWRYTTKQTWVLNHMIHDLTASPQNVYLSYTLYFIPDTAPEAANITPIDTQWMDVQGIKPYPVFNAIKGKGTKTRSGTTEFTYPDQAPNAYKADGIVRNRWVVDHDGTLVSTAGHLHPGGLWTDLNITRDGVTKRLFRSRANYFEPAGNISWDVAMSATAPDWKVNVKKGDVLSISATYDTSRASWYEVMGIMVVGITKEPVPGGVDPFTGTVDQTDYLTHGRLPENIDSGVRKHNPGLRNPIRLRTGPYKDRVVIKNFLYSQGDLSYPGKRGLPPAVRQGRSLTFVNEDNPLTLRFHTITACKAPCNLTGGIGYPLANGAGFDSGELGYGPTISMGLYGGGGGTVPITAAVDKPTAKTNCKSVPGLVNVIANGCVGTVVYKTPKNLRPGTYSYFCRIHPFMRGAFRVVKKKS
jgi:plastocyanin